MRRCDPPAHHQVSDRMSQPATVPSRDVRPGRPRAAQSCLHHLRYCVRPRQGRSVLSAYPDRLDARAHAFFVGCTSPPCASPARPARPGHRSRRPTAASSKRCSAAGPSWNAGPRWRFIFGRGVELRKRAARGARLFGRRSVCSARLHSISTILCFQAEPLRQPLRYFMVTICARLT